jgi:hypothetical protein
MNGDNLNNIRCEVSRHFRNKKREHQKNKINGLVISSKNKNIRDWYTGTHEFQKSYQLRTNFVMDENGDLLANSHNNSERWKNCFSQLLNVHTISGVRQKYIQLGC